MSYNCEILADSLSPQGERLTTMKITFPRIMLAEFNTHRMFSRNSASSRAIPFNKMVKMVEETPFIPIAWQRDHKGMQGNEYLDVNPNTYGPINLWLEAKNKAIETAKSLHELAKVTKQLCNRLLEPFMWHTVIITSSKEGLDNFFELRCPNILHEANGKYYKSVKDWNNVDKEIQYQGLSCLHPENKSQADIHIQAIAELMWDTYNESNPKKLQVGEWHIPFGDNIDARKVYEDVLKKDIDLSISAKFYKEYEESLIKIATARCARISYETLGDNSKIDYEADLKLHDMLLESRHASAFEHCCRVLTEEEYNILGKMVLHPENEYVFENGWVDNFKGFISYRRILNI